MTPSRPPLYPLYSRSTPPLSVQQRLSEWVRAGRRAPPRSPGRRGRGGGGRRRAGGRGCGSVGTASGHRTGVRAPYTHPSQPPCQY
eukprot:3562649-Pyramimonas_sp.AAC.2